jgi:hypothetical protein
MLLLFMPGGAAGNMIFSLMNSSDNGCVPGCIFRFNFNNIANEPLP